MSGSSYRTILRSSSIIGGAQVINIAAGLLKMKAVAVLLGPAGVGLVGLYLNLVQTASSMAALGVGNVGTRQIAIAHVEGRDDAVGRTRRALFWGTLLLALIGTAIFWLASGWIATWVVGDASRAGDVAWLSFGVALTVAAASQGALLTGMRHIGDLARINVGAAIFGTIFGVLALWFFGPQGLIGMVLAAPITTYLIGHFYVGRLGPPAGAPLRLSQLSREWRSMATLGFAFMLSSLVAAVGHLAVRTLVQRELGPEALGQFQAAWSIGMTYLGLILGAVGTDYYPRLTAVIGEGDKATRLINEQTEVALLLCAPILLAMLGLTPWVINLLYSAEFGPAVEILRWHLLGGILKVISWPLVFVLLASGKGKTYIAIESIGMGAFFLGVAVLLPVTGVTAAGIAFLVLYLPYLPLLWWLIRRNINFRWTRAVKLQGLGLIGAAAAVDISARSSDTLAALLGIGLAVAAGIWGLLRLSAMAEFGGRLAAIGRWRME